MSAETALRDVLAEMERRADPRYNDSERSREAWERAADLVEAALASPENALDVEEMKRDIWRRFVATLAPSGTLGRASTRRSAVGLHEAYAVLRQVLDENRMARQTMTIEGRFWTKVDRRGDAECWPWLAYRGADGYGTFNRERRSPERAHRVAYELTIGPIPDGMQLDHLCRNRGCVNPSHLEPVTNRVNVLRGVSIAAQRARQTTCKRGHELGGDNLRIDRHGHRRCRRCQTDWQNAKDRETRRIARLLADPR